MGEVYRNCSQPDLPVVGQSKNGVISLIGVFYVLSFTVEQLVSLESNSEDRPQKAEDGPA